jgi:hypothetical protein
MEVANRHKLLLQYLKGLDRYYPRWKVKSSRPI